MEIFEHYYIPKYVTLDKRLKSGAIILYGDIYTTCMHSEEGIFTACNKEIAKSFDATTTTISKWISQLSKLNYINCYMEYEENSNHLKRRVITVNDDYFPFAEYTPQNTSVSAYLYLLKDKDSLYKIGISRDPKARALGFKNRKAEVIFFRYINNAQETESMIHEFYESYRIDKKSEWFDFKDKNIDDIIFEINKCIC